jgi:hypothetical protein
LPRLCFWQPRRPARRKKSRVCQSGSRWLRRRSGHGGLPAQNRPDNRVRRVCREKQELNEVGWETFSGLSPSFLRFPSLSSDPLAYADANLREVINTIGGDAAFHAELLPAQAGIQSIRTSAFDRHWKVHAEEDWIGCEGEVVSKVCFPPSATLDWLLITDGTAK